MIHYVGTGHTLNAVRWFLGTLPAAERPPLRCLPYSRLFRARRLPEGAWIFADLERLGPHEQERAAAVWRALDDARRAGAAVRLLNHPIRSMRRYELLRALHDRGINRFDVFRPDEGRRPKRYPVFLRGERDHDGAASGLLEDADALEAALEARVHAGRSLDGLIIEEFCGERDARGRFRKYAAFRIGDCVVARHLYADEDWVVKAPAASDAALAAEELDYLRANPHREVLEEVFRVARIDYGRADYGVVDGRVQIYEINTAPLLDGVIDESRRPAIDAGNPRLLAALTEIDCAGDAPAASIRVPRTWSGPSAYALRHAFQHAMRAVGLLRYEPRVRFAVKRELGQLRRRSPRDARGATRRP